MRLCDKMKHAENRIMKKKITLPFEEQLVMRRYHSMAFPTGIIQGDAKEILHHGHWASILVE